MALSKTTFASASGNGPYAIGFTYIDPSHVKVYVNGSLVSSANYSIASGQVTFTSGAPSSQQLVIQRETPGRTDATKSYRAVDFVNGSTINEADLDNSFLQVFYMTQEALDTGNGALPYNSATDAFDAGLSGNKKVTNVATPTVSTDAANKGYVDTTLSTTLANNAMLLSSGQWDAESLKIQNLGNPQNSNDAVTKAYVDALSLYGGSAIQPQSWTYTLNNTTDWVDQGTGVDASSRYRATKQLSGLLSYDANTLIVSFGGVLQTPSNAYTLSNDNLSLYASAKTAGNLTVRNFGVSRSAFAPATSSNLGAVKIGNNITVQADGTISTATLSTVATSGLYSDLSGKPTLGTAAAKDIPAAGNASATQVVYGSDTRLTDSRTPVAHSHAISDVTNLQTLLDAKASLAGAAFTGAGPTFAADPPTPNSLTRKQYVDSAISTAGTSKLSFSQVTVTTAVTVTPSDLAVGEERMYMCGSGGSVLVKVGSATPGIIAAHGYRLSGINPCFTRMWSLTTTTGTVMEWIAGSSYSQPTGSDPTTARTLASNSGYCVITRYA
jgi:Phage T7 tail fibre protein